MAHAHIPAAFRPLLRSEMETAIEQANLGRENTEIAKLYLLDRVPQIEIAVELGCERSTVSRRMPEIIGRVAETVQKLRFT